MKRTRTLSQLFLFVLLLSGTTLQAQTASELLQRAAQSEAVAPSGQTIGTRFFSVERKVRNEPDATRFTMEMRQAPTLSAVSFRLYDDTQHLLVGDWANTKENKTYRYEAGSAALTEVASGASLWFTGEDLQVIKPTAAAFGLLLSASSQTVVEETRTAYTITCRFEDASPLAGLLKARWVWNRAAQEVSHVFLTLENKDAIIDYKIAAVTAGRPALETVAVVNSLDDVWFNPTPAALSEMAAHGEPSAKTKLPVASPEAANAPASPAVTPIASTTFGTIQMLEVGGGLRERAVRQPLPAYRVGSRQYRQTGTVKAYLEINEKGEVTKIKKMEGLLDLQNAVLQVVTRWRFTPATVKGQPARMTGYLVFNFKE